MKLKKNIVLLVLLIAFTGCTPKSTEIFERKPVKKGPRIKKTLIPMNNLNISESNWFLAISVKKNECEFR